MGLPKIEILFKTLAASAITRSARGIVALILRDTKTNAKEYKGIEEVKDTDFDASNIKYIKEAFYGTPSKVIVVPIAADDPVSEALNVLKGMYWNYLAMPEATTADISDIVAFIKGQRANKKKIFKAVVPNAAGPDHEGIINFTTTGITMKDGSTKTTEEFCVRLASVFAGLPFTRSATYYVFPDVASIDEIDDPDEAIDNGELILINDGKKVKIGRAVNSLVTFTPEKSKSFSKIRIVEILDMILEDIRTTFEDSYVGKYPNSFQNKLMFISAINAYFQGLVIENVLEREGENKARIDTEAQKLYLESIGKDTSEMSDGQILRANTGSNVFLAGNISVLDAMEDLKFVIGL
ncbi:phage tail sheath C-terminal domain-containing protein [Aneurinibacillus thermoaerophilus]|uniref:phage tail sheath C-terminal domain-containing protein n=1 Tax=Aneurinibacillus thermoaerophilus TaxID=143495 RepID=UPI002E230381|nr:phage tail sheath C-terminal domain-containing protein [Aneurinibacillus thermoaerophilus]MED0766026.1 phage tail sheath C-terminal domain-containing protein [Aneurinibacillus thermoaerophilus]